MKRIVVKLLAASFDLSNGCHVESGMNRASNLLTSPIGRHRLWVSALLFVLGILASTSVVAQIPFQRVDVVSGDYSGLPAQTATNGPEFGFSVAISGEWMAVGAPATLETHQR